MKGEQAGNGWGIVVRLNSWSLQTAANSRALKDWQNLKVTSFGFNDTVKYFIDPI